MVEGLAPRDLCDFKSNGPRQLKHSKGITRISKKRTVCTPLDEASNLFQTWPSCTLANHKLVWLLGSITVNNVCAHREWKETTCGTMWPSDHILTNQIVELYIQLLCSNSYYRIWSDVMATIFFTVHFSVDTIWVRHLFHWRAGR